jgi:hypothetical protein
MQYTGSVCVSAISTTSRPPAAKHPPATINRPATAPEARPAPFAHRQPSVRFHPLCFDDWETLLSLSQPVFIIAWLEPPSLPSRTLHQNLPAPASQFLSVQLVPLLLPPHADELTFVVDQLELWSSFDRIFPLVPTLARSFSHTAYLFLECMYANLFSHSRSIMITLNVFPTVLPPSTAHPFQRSGSNLYNFCRPFRAIGKLSVTKKYQLETMNFPNIHHQTFDVIEQSYRTSPAWAEVTVVPLILAGSFRDTLIPNR